MSELTLRQLQYFVAVVDLGSVTAAARKCHISQSAASMALAQLEKAVSADLLLRTRSKKVVPTAAGAEFAVHAREILARVAAAGEAVTESLEQLRGVLRVGCSDTLSPRLIPPLVDHFASNHPGVDVVFHEGAPADIQDEVANGRLDVALVYALQAVPELDHVRIADVRLHVMLPARHRLACRGRVSLTELAGETAILLDIPPTIERLDAILRSVGVEPATRWASSNMETIRSLVARGLGYSLVNSPPATNSTFEGGSVAYIPVSDDIAPNAIHIMLPRGNRPPRRVVAAVEFLREQERSGME